MNLKWKLEKKNPPSLINRIRVAGQGLSSSYGPTKLHLKSLDMARKINQEINSLLDILISKEVNSLENKIKISDGPVIIED